MKPGRPGKKRQVLPIMTAVLTVLLCAALCFTVLSQYLDGLRQREILNSQTEPIFTQEAMARRLLWVSPLFSVWLLFSVFAGIKGRKPKDISARQQDKPILPQKENGDRMRRIRLGLYALSAVLIVWGVLNGGLNDVLVKAIHICTECIGLG